MTVAHTYAINDVRLVTLGLTSISYCTSLQYIGILRSLSIEDSDETIKAKDRIVKYTSSETSEDKAEIQFWVKHDIIKILSRITASKIIMPTNDINHIDLFFTTISSSPIIDGVET